METNLNITLDEATLRKAERWAGGLDERVRRIVYSSANRAAVSGRVVIKKAVKKDLAVAPGNLRLLDKIIKIDKATSEEHPVASITMQGAKAGFPLSRFRLLSKVRSGHMVRSPQVQSWRNRSPAVAERSFLVKLDSGHVAVLQRVPGSGHVPTRGHYAPGGPRAGKRKPIEREKVIEPRGPTLTDVLAQQPETLNRVEARIRDVFARGVEGQLERLMEGG